ncbi:MAG: hypothetical protein K2N42_05975, partial [Anaeroplasmataceae bacterium]|nr:hypothetical protein [Anaeroplasmataceae bacterium]
TLKAKGTIVVVYEGQTLVFDVIYSNETVYVAYENIKLKISQSTIMELMADKLSAAPAVEIEEIIDLVQELVKELTITENTLGLCLNLGVVLAGMNEATIVLTNTKEGFDITSDLYELSVSLDVTKEEKIEVEDGEYSSIEGYLDLVEYILSIINKESLNIELCGTYYLEDMPVTFNGNIELMYNPSTSQYDVFMLLTIVVSEITAQVKLTYVEDKLYIELYDTVIEISASEFDEVISAVCEKFNVSIEQSNDALPLDSIVSLTKVITIFDSSIEFNLSQYVSLFTRLVLSYNKIENGYEFTINQNNLLDITLSVSTISYEEITIPNATLYKEDLMVLLDNISYVLELVKGNAIHLDMNDALMQLTINEKEESISINGFVDLLWNVEGIQAAGSFLVDGAGILAEIGIVVIDNTIYLTISNQTFSLKLNEINDFIAEALEILSPMVSMDMPSMDSTSFALDLKDLGFMLTSGSVEASLEALIGKACTLLVAFDLVEEGMNTQVNISYDDLVQFEAPILISSSEIKEIKAPSKVIDKDELLEILAYVVNAYELSLKDEFNLSISTLINTNGEVVANISGNVYIKLLENQEFDAHLDLIVHEYSNGNEVAWHQLDLQVISLTTMNTLDPSVGVAMMYAIYGNNPNDLDAVIKVKSTYTGIEDLIASVMQLMNLDIPALSGETTSSSMDIRSLIDYLEVTENSLSIGIEANALFAAMQDERQIVHITFAKNLESKLESVLIDNLFVTYTNTANYMKLDSLQVALQDREVSFVIPSADELSKYYDISEISNLFEALYYNALEKNYEISGTVTLTALSVVNVNMPVLF